MAMESPRILHALRRLNDLQAKRPRGWVKGLTENERMLAIEHARMGIPSSILAHHELFVSRGKRSLAEVRHGVCTACLMNLPAAHPLPASPIGRIDVCDHCGVFLFWTEAEAVETKPPTGAVKAKRPKVTSQGKGKNHPSP